MILGDLTLIQKIALFAIPGLLAITLHEVAHGLAARSLGDRTAEMLGRLTLNPLKHIDPLGTLAVPTLMLVMGLPPIGWAKPVPIGTRNLRHPQRGMALVAAAGPASNLLMALAWALVAHLAVTLGAQPGGIVLPALYGMGLAGLFFNVILAVLNMLPIPPLDGGRVVNGFLSPTLSDKFLKIEPFGLIIVIGLLWAGLLWPIMRPLVSRLLDLGFAVAGVPATELFRLLG